MHSRRFGMVFIATVLMCLGLIGGAGRAWAVDMASQLTVEADIQTGGDLEVTQTLTFEGGAPDEITQRIALTETTFDDAYFQFEVTDVAATADGKAVDVTTTTQGEYLVITVPTGGADEVAISYRATGMIFDEGNDKSEFRWRLLQGLSVGVENFHGEVVPGTSSFEDLTCESGAPDSPRVCGSFSGGTHASQVPSFNDGPLGPGEIVRVGIGFPAGSMSATEVRQERWTLDRAFSFDLWPLLAALGTLALGGIALWMLHRGRGRDEVAAQPTRIASFEPAGEGVSAFELHSDVRPGQLGTLADERVDPVDVTASLLDLAVRGHLLINEETGAGHALDWTLERRDGGDELAGWEEDLLTAVAPDGSGRVSALGTSVAAAVPQIQQDLYADLVSRGWYAARPDQTRQRWALIGWIGLAVAVVLLAILAWLTSFGLVGLVAVGLAIGLLFVAQEMPARTARGSAVLAGLQTLAGEIQTQPTDQMPPGREYEELSQVLPYAVVLGGQERWLEALVAADDDAESDERDLDWYHGPGGWHLADLPASIGAFITTVTGVLFRRG